MQMNPKRKGEIAENIVVTKLLRMGLDVFTACSEDGRVDLIVDDGDLHRVQVKSGRYKGGSIRFKCQSVVCSQTETRREGYEGDIDVFVVYNEDIDEMFAVPIDDANAAQMRIRIEDPKQEMHNLNWADDYRVDEYFEGP